MKEFQEICKRMRVGEVMYIPVEHAAEVDAGHLYREFFKETYYAFDHRGVNFVSTMFCVRSHGRSGRFRRRDASIEGNSG